MLIFKVALVMVAVVFESNAKNNLCEQEEYFYLSKMDRVLTILIRPLNLSIQVTKNLTKPWKDSKKSCSPGGHLSVKQRLVVQKYIASQFKANQLQNIHEILKYNVKSFARIYKRLSQDLRDPLPSIPLDVQNLESIYVKNLCNSKKDQSGVPNFLIQENTRCLNKAIESLVRDERAIYYLGSILFYSYNLIHIRKNSIEADQKHSQEMVKIIYDLRKKINTARTKLSTRPVRKCICIQMFQNLATNHHTMQETSQHVVLYKIVQLYISILEKENIGNNLLEELRHFLASYKKKFPFLGQKMRQNKKPTQASDIMELADHFCCLDITLRAINEKLQNLIFSIKI